MIYQELLYSRSLSKDYRWMIVPPKVSPESLKTLNQLYNLYDKHKHTFSKTAVLPLYCINHAGMTFLVSCGPSNHKDKDGRDIYCLQGICVRQEYQRHLWLNFPWILVNYQTKGALNIWRSIDFSQADDLVRHASGDCFFRFGQEDKPLSELTKPTNPPSGKLFTDEPTYISFDKDGLKELSHLLVSNYHTCVDFAFGVTPEMIKQFDFKIIAEAGNGSKIKNTGDMVTTEVASSRVPAAKVIRELFEDPLARFDPKKNVDMPRMKVLRGSRYPRVFSQFLPRLLSLLKTGKKLNQSESSGQ